MTWIWIILALLYVLSRIDLVPDMIPFWGWLDDFVVLFMLFRYLSRLARTPPRSSPQNGNGRRDTRRPTGGEEHTRTGPQTPYQILGVPPGASKEEIRSAYLRLANQYHPDKVAHLGEEFQKMAEQRFKEIQQAYQTLTGSNAR